MRPHCAACLLVTHLTGAPAFAPENRPDFPSSDARTPEVLSVIVTQSSNLDLLGAVASSLGPHGLPFP